MFEAKLTPGFIGCQTWALVHIQLMTDNKENSRNIIPGLVGEMTVSMIERQTYLRLTLAHPFPGGLSSSSLSSFPSGVSFLDPCRPLFPAAASWKPVSGRAKRYVFIKATTHPFTEQRRKNCGENHRTRT